MRIGIIDLGTNTFNLLIAEIDAAGNYHRVYTSKVAVKLGEGSFEKKYISEEAFQRALIALDNQIAAIKERHCDQILAFATAAMRNATNASQFIQRVRDVFGVTIQIIDGDKEAEMIYNGIVMANAIEGNGNALIMDIGGGSTEFIIANEKEMLWKRSFELGVSRLLENLHPHDPIRSEEIESTKAMLRETLQPLKEALKQFPVSSLIGSSGSFDTLADILAFRRGEGDSINQVPAVDFDMAELKGLLAEIIGSTREQRIAMPGMVPLRIDMIVLAAIFIQLTLEDFQINLAKVSRYALREGVLFDVLNQAR